MQGNAGAHRVVAQPRGMSGQVRRLPDAFHAHVGNQRSAFSGPFGAQFPDRDLLIMGQQSPSPDPGPDKVAGERSRIPTGEIVLDLGAINVAIMVERRSDGGENPRKFHEP